MVVIDFLLLLTHWRWMMTIGKYTFIVTSKVKFAPSCLSFPWFQAMRASCTSPCLPYSYYFDSITNLFDFLFLQTFLSLLLDNLMIWVFLFQLKFRGVVRIFELVLCSMIPFPPLGPLSCSRVCTLAMGGTSGGWILSIAYKFFAWLGFGAVALFESWFDELWAFGLETLSCCSVASGLFHNLRLRGSLCSLLPLNFIFDFSC